MFKKASGTALLAAALTMALAVSAFALNYAGSGGGSGNKSFGFFGYEYVDSNHIKLFFNKTLSSPPKISLNQFSYKTHSGGSPVAFSNISTASGAGYSGCGDTNLTNGSTVYLTTNSGFSANTLYDLTVTAGTLADNNKLTLANYTNKADFTFAFKTPDGSGNYTGTPMITFFPEDNASSAAQENNILLVMDRPVANPSTFKSYLSAGLNYYDTHNDVLQDPTIDSNYTDPASTCYEPHYNTARTAFFFPMTGNGSSTKAYNLPTSTHFELIVPGFSDDDSNSYGGETIDFTTWSTDIATWTDAVPYVYASSPSTLTVRWVDSTINEPPDYFNVWYTDEDEYVSSNWIKANSTPVTGASPFEYQITGLDSSTTYYIRVEPVANSNGDRPAGYSEALTAITD